MGNSMDDNIAVLERENRAPVSLTRPKGTRLTAQRRDAEMRRGGRSSDCFQALQQPPRVCLRHEGQLLEDPPRDDEGHRPI